MHADEDFRDRVAELLGDPYCKKSEQEFAAEGFQYIMVHPDAAARAMEDLPGAETYLGQVMKDTGYKIKKKKKGE